MLPEIYNLEGETTTDAWKKLDKHEREIRDMDILYSYWTNMD